MAQAGPAEGEPAGRQAAALAGGAAGDGPPDHRGGAGEEEPRLGSRCRPAAQQVSGYKPQAFQVGTAPGRSRSLVTHQHRL